MIGQIELLTQLNSYTKQNFPKSLLLMGEQGCGKHLVSNIIANKLNVELEDITNNLNLDYLSEINLRTIPKLYLIDCDLISVKEQNIILKFVEEPSSLVNIVLISSNSFNLLETIKNRCVIMSFKKYTIEELKQIKPNLDEELYNICNTPGQILKNEYINFKELKDFCILFITKINKASCQNTLTIVNKLNLSDEYNKFDLNTFLKLTLKLSLQYFIQTNDIKYKYIYEITSKYYTRLLQDSKLIKKQLVENYLVNLWLKIHKGV